MAADTTLVAAALLFDDLGVGTWKFVGFGVKFLGVLFLLKWTVLAGVDGGGMVCACVTRDCGGGFDGALLLAVLGAVDL